MDFRIGPLPYLQLSPIHRPGFFGQGEPNLLFGRNSEGLIF